MIFRPPQTASRGNARKPPKNALKGVKNGLKAKTCGVKSVLNVRGVKSGGKNPVFKEANKTKTKINKKP